MTTTVQTSGPRRAVRVPRLRGPLWICLSALLAIAAPAATFTNGAHVYFDLGHWYHGQSVTSATVRITPKGGASAIGGRIIVLDRLDADTDTAGQFYVSNMTAGRYTVNVVGPYTTTPFDITVPDTNDVVLNAWELGPATNTPASAEAYMRGAYLRTSSGSGTNNTLRGLSLPEGAEAGFEPIATNSAGKIAYSRPSTWDVTRPPFRARGDGVTDDTVAVQAGVDYVASIGGTLFFPEGTYLLSAPVRMTNHCTLKGHGKPTFKGVGTTNLLFVGRTGISTADFNCYKVQGFRFGGSDAAFVNSVYVEPKVTRTIITDNEFFHNNTNGSEIFLGGDQWFVAIHDNLFFGRGFYGPMAVECNSNAVINSINLNFSRNRVSTSFSRPGLYCNGAAITIENNTIEGRRQAIILDGYASGVMAHSATITGNYFESYGTNEYDGVVIYKGIVSGLVMRNNYANMHNGTDGQSGSFIAPFDDASVLNNSFIDGNRVIRPGKKLVRMINRGTNNFNGVNFVTPDASAAFFATNQIDTLESFASALYLENTNEIRVATSPLKFRVAGTEVMRLGNTGAVVNQPITLDFLSTGGHIWQYFAEQGSNIWHINNAGANGSFQIGKGSDYHIFRIDSNGTVRLEYDLHVGGNLFIDNIFDPAGAGYLQLQGTNALLSTPLEIRTGLGRLLTLDVTSSGVGYVWARFKSLVGDWLINDSANDGSLQIGNTNKYAIISISPAGAITLDGPLLINNAGSGAPTNTVTPKLWVPVNINGTNVFIEGYQ